MTLERVTRYQAAPIHFVISLVIAAIVVGAMLLLWYPKPYFEAAGGARLVLLLVGVDVVLGPLLTFLVFDTKKKHLMLDLAVIAMIQAAALTYGVMVMFDARPVFMTFAGNRFELVSANEIDAADLERALPSFRNLPLMGPQVVGTAFPDNAQERERLMMATMLGGNIGLFPQHYVPYSTVARSVVTQSLPLSTLREKHPEQAGEINAIVAASRTRDSALRYLPLTSRRGDMAVVVDAANGEIKGVVAADPK